MNIFFIFSIITFILHCSDSSIATESDDVKLKQIQNNLEVQEKIMKNFKEIFARILPIFNEENAENEEKYANLFPLNNQSCRRILCNAFAVLLEELQELVELLQLDKNREFFLYGGDVLNYYVTQYAEKAAEWLNEAKECQENNQRRHCLTLFEPGKSKLSDAVFQFARLGRKRVEEVKDLANLAILKTFFDARNFGEKFRRTGDFMVKIIKSHEKTGNQEQLDGALKQLNGDNVKRITFKEFYARIYSLVSIFTMTNSRYFDNCSQYGKHKIKLEKLSEEAQRLHLLSLNGLQFVQTLIFNRKSNNFFNLRKIFGRNNLNQNLMNLKSALPKNLLLLKTVAEGGDFVDICDKLMQEIYSIQEKQKGEAKIEIKVEPLEDLMKSLFKALPKGLKVENLENFVGINFYETSQKVKEMSKKMVENHEFALEIGNELREICDTLSAKETVYNWQTVDTVFAVELYKDVEELVGIGEKEVGTDKKI